MTIFFISFDVMQFIPVGGYELWNPVNGSSNQNQYLIEKYYSLLYDYLNSHMNKLY